MNVKWAALEAAGWAAIFAIAAMIVAAGWFGIVVAAWLADQGGFLP